MKKNKLFLIFSPLVFLVAVVCVSVFLGCIYIPCDKSEAETSRFEVVSGMSVRGIGAALKNAGFIRSDRVFYLAVRYPFLVKKDSVVLRSGVYYLSPSMNVCKILDELEQGLQEFNRTVVPEGLTLSKIAGILEEKGVCSSVDFISACKNSELLRKYGLSASSFEGFLYPDTYFFTSGLKGEAVVKMMADNFIAHQNQIADLKGKSFDEIYNVVTLASIVEREYRVASEAPLIASVFTNRIKHGIGLYSCATIEYIITEIQGKPHPEKITYEDLSVNSPYNTYKWAGLTPGPISNPGLVALSACANPPVTDYYYFTLTDAAAGKHTFSKTFSSHIKAGTEFKTKKVSD